MPYLALGNIEEEFRSQNSGVRINQSGIQTILLEGIVANPEQRITQLPILSESELHNLLFEWNNTQLDYPQDKR